MKFLRIFAQGFRGEVIQRWERTDGRQTMDRERLQELILSLQLR